jgi:hypothetical protein
MLVITNISAPNRPKSAPRSSPHTPPPRFGALAHRLRRCAPMLRWRALAHIGAHWRKTCVLKTTLRLVVAAIFGTAIRHRILIGMPIYL